MVIHVTINAKLLAGRGESTARGVSYRGFLWGVLAYYASDAAWGVFAGLGWIGAWYVDTILFFLSLVAFAIMWGRFVVAYVGFGKWSARVLSWLGYGLLLFNIVALVANIFNNCVFHFDAAGTYIGGPLRDPLFHAFIAFNALISLFVFVKSLGCSGAVRGRNMIVFVNCFTMTVAMALQVIWPLTPFTALGCLIGNCFLHAFVVEHEHSAKHMKALETALQRAREAEKTRSTFFSIVSHDIRTPLNAILGYAELLEGGMLGEAEREEALKSIRSSGTTLLQLVNDVLDFSKMDAGKMKFQSMPVVLNRLTEEVFASFRLAASEKGIELVNDTANVPTLMLDGHRFRQILFNLLGNALKFTSRGSVTVSAEYEGETLTFSVADTGCGIEQKMLGRILEPFVQIVNPRHSGGTNSGTGLGLAICKRIVEVMGGTLTVESELGKGSKFTAKIPSVIAIRGNAAQDGEIREPIIALDKLPKHVLVVDDSTVNSSVLKAFLAKVGVTAVDFAHDGSEALTKLHKAVHDGNPFDFVFTDFWMPNMNGMELVEKIRADSNLRDLPVFVVTADTECHNDERVKLFTGVLFKPLTYDKLVESLSSVKRA